MPENPPVPDIACPTYNEFATRYGGAILQDLGDLQLVDGDLAMTRDFDLMLGDKPYDAMRRLLDDWRCKTPHLKVMFSLSELMIHREAEVGERLSQAEVKALSGEYRPFALSQSPAYQKAWQAHFDEEAAAQAGRDVYPACIVLMASYALSRFRDDIECSKNDWKTKGPTFGGRSVGEILVASANGVRHQDEWFKTHPPTPQQQLSRQVLTDALGAQGPHTSLAYSGGRCEEVISLLNQGNGFDGLTQSMFVFAHEIAESCRLKGN
ncbi:hypothetical protein [Rhizobium leguminosarum]|uniref:Uncharacterized protein n=1 Tax=Rhizobium leguminosarum TaxID=384 RepID=A0A7K3VTA8_RHILE|nr:hypothetical protein [Rhizobium leguminosarum]NEK19758.1 hypothetical protein [Rhizobium leguminosarum]